MAFAQAFSPTPMDDPSGYNAAEYVEVHTPAVPEKNISAASCKAENRSTARPCHGV
jgi:hypothetical protein